jgi:hypothetical protein
MERIFTWGKEKLKKISKEDQSRILKRLFAGESYGEAAEYEGHCKSTVKSVYDEFVGFAADSSLEGAAQECQVYEEIDFLRELATEMRRASLSKKDLMAGARLRRLVLKLGATPEQLEEVLSMCNRTKEKFGDFVQAALRLYAYEYESGKTYPEIVSEYESKTASVKVLRTEKTDLEKKIVNLNEDFQIATLMLKALSVQSREAQAILDEYNATKEELSKYGLKTKDYPMVKKVLDEIERQGGEIGDLIALLAKATSLVDGILLLEDRLKQQEEANEAEKQRHKAEMQTLERQHNDRIDTLTHQEIDLRKEIEKKEKTLNEIIAENNKQNTRRDTLKANITTLEQQVDGLLKTQAERLGTLADIDAVNEALAARKNELTQTETKIEENKPLVMAALVIAALLAKKPTDRDAIIQFLHHTKQDATYRPFDDLARRRIVEVMAEQGYVPKADLEKSNKDAEEKIKQCNEQTEAWKRIAGRRREELETFQNQYLALRKEQEGKLDKSIDEKLSNLAVQIAETVSFERSENPP